ncbi:transketolase [Ignavibacteria bacterium 4148-Me]|uniref:transketolase n=1 Tax=Rosettibacter primus TaxID=3111523 RepID=UPI00336BAF3D
MTNTELKKLAANTIRILAAEGVQKANSGHPGMPMGMADVAMILWTEFLTHNPDDPKWYNRDRFILSAGHGSMLIYTLLHLSGYDVTIDDLKSFRQWGSRTAGHPEYGLLPGIETTTGPLGQGFGNGVGMAIAAKMIAARFNDEKNQLFGNHYIYAIVSDGDLMEGISHEAASIAGHLKLGNIIYFYDDNHITIEGNTEITFSEDIQKRFEAYGWQVLKTDAYDHDGIRKAIIEAQNEKEKPTLIITRSHIGYGSPNKVDTAEVHGAPLGEDELLATKKNLGWPIDKEFYVPDEVKKLFEDRKNELKKIYDQWQNDFDNWKKSNPEKAELLNKYLNNWLPENLEEELLAAAPKEPNATRSLSSKVIQKIAQLVPNFIGGSADLAPSTNTYMKDFESIAPNKFNGRNFHFGIREHAMGAIINGIALYGGFRPFGATFFVFSDYMRPTIRLAAIMEIPVIYVFTHDSIFVGEDGPTHQPVEHLAVLRAIPNVTVIRPADGIETAMAWSIALRHKEGPVALILTRQKIDAFERDSDFNPKDIQKGAYIVSREKEGKLDLVIAASGSEVPVAVEAKKILSNDLSIRVVSIPSKELFEKQSDEYKKSLFPNNVPVVIIEAASMTGWGDLFRQKLLRVGIERFGASAPYKILAEKFGLTGKQVAEKIKNWL